MFQKNSVILARKYDIGKLISPVLFCFSCAIYDTVAGKRKFLWCY